MHAHAPIAPTEAVNLDTLRLSAVCPSGVCICFGAFNSNSSATKSAFHDNVVQVPSRALRGRHMMFDFMLLAHVKHTGNEYKKNRHAGYIKCAQ
jgi:hypothetical protein